MAGMLENRLRFTQDALTEKAMAPYVPPMDLEWP